MSSVLVIFGGVRECFDVVLVIMNNLKPSEEGGNDVKVEALL